MTLDEYLKDNGKSQSALAREVNCAQSAISQFLAQKRGLSPSLAKRISEATGGEVKILDLLYPEQKTGAAAE